MDDKRQMTITVHRASVVPLRATTMSASSSSSSSFKPMPVSGSPPTSLSHAPTDYSTPQPARLTIVSVTPLAHFHTSPAADSDSRPHHPVAGYGFLLPFPASYPSLLADVASVLCLPSEVVSRIRLFVDEGADEQHTAAAHHYELPATTATATAAAADNGTTALSAAAGTPAAWSMGRKGGELTAGCFDLLRDNDVLHATLARDESVPTALAPATAPASPTPSTLLSAASAAERRGSGGRVELRVLDVVSGVVQRLQIKPRKRLQQLIAKYEQHRGWTAGTARITYRKRRREQQQQRAEAKESEASDEFDGPEMQLSGEETCESLQLADGALLTAYKRASSG